MKMISPDSAFSPVERACLLHNRRNLRVVRDFVINRRLSGGVMARRQFVAVVIACAVVVFVFASLASAQQRAADGVAINDDGLPQYSTFSLCAIDPATGQSGASVTTRVPFVGRAVPHVRAGVGAVCTQASTMVEYGPRGLDLIAKGVEPQAVLAQLLADDAQRESRQVGVIDMKGRAAAHTGKQNGNWAGSRQGKNNTLRMRELQKSDPAQYDEET